MKIYRMHNDKNGQVTKNFKVKEYAQTLDAWHYADKYKELPKLSGRWITESKENIDRTLAVQSSNSHQFFCNFYFDQTWTRPLPIYSIPGLETI